jgi:hypothetical protein
MKEQRPVEKIARKEYKRGVMSLTAGGRYPRSPSISHPFEADIITRARAPASLNVLRFESLSSMRETDC